MTKLLTLVAAMLLATLVHIPTHAQNKRIVSLAPSLSKQLYLLHAQSQLVGCTSFCKQAIEDGKPVVASAIDVNIEKVISLQPDIVITSTLTKPATIRTLKKLGIEVSVFPYPKSFDALNQQFLTLGKKIGKEKEAVHFIDKQKKRLGKALARIKPTSKQTIFMEIGAKPLFCAVPNTFMHDYIQMVGCQNAAQELTRGSISREKVLLLNPDIICIVTMGIVGDEEKKNWSNFTALKATQKNQIFIIDSTIASTPTPDNFVSTVEQLIELIYY